MSIEPSPRALRVGLLGLGTVGRATAACLLDDAWRTRVDRPSQPAPVLAAIGILDPDRPRGIDVPPSVRRTDALDDLAVDPGIDVVVELLGGVERAGGLVRRALDAGKHVVTANKALLATHGAELEARARAAGVALRFEAAVGGGVPVLTLLGHDLAANRITAVRGVINGTTNFILDAMASDGSSFERALVTAQERGYAEADASADLEGRDPAQKAAVVARLAFGAWPDPGTIRRSVPDARGVDRPGITGLTATDLRAAAELGFSIRLLAELRTDAGPDAAGSMAASVLPVAVPLASPFGQGRGVTNTVEVTGEPLGTVTLSGPGAGGGATSSAVLADLLALSRGEGSTWGTSPEPSRPLAVVDPLDEPRGWLLVTDDTSDRADEAWRPFNGSIAARASGAVVTVPMRLDEVRGCLTDAPAEVRLYPLLATAA